MTEMRYGLPVVRTDRMPESEYWEEHWLVGAFGPAPAEPNRAQRRAVARQAKEEKKS